jgi:uncharacterized UPF0160 family protein
VAVPGDFTNLPLPAREMWKACSLLLGYDPRMATTVATHSGSFHADDVLAFALIRAFHDRDATVIRTRDLDTIHAADIAIDVGGSFDPATGRFDHHQASYAGERSSAGMVLDWLEAESKVTTDVANSLRRDLVDHVDAVDNGRVTPTSGVPCFSTLIAISNNTAGDAAEFLQNYLDAAAMAVRIVDGVRAGCAQIAAARAAVIAGMAEAKAAGRAVIYLDSYCVWKPAYFENGGIDHPTDYVLFPGEGKWRVVAIPPEPGSFANKRPLPEEWAGLVDDELSAVIGVEGARFCHKNRFIAVFETRQAALAAMERWGLM